ncbi:RING/FYVE/PHD zinc finger superfamily protein, putative isoform 3 [Hibiscus syriacus]|uniref:RING/FYVE/PHD zinc finger superfamily protein, putative isoform 3 n=1 Tax=Hibiscus syriacus TaxID=106335 RepID=A0A6A3BP30_HIBSY|nr:RING/FYVE/PHD zinc finger superfamily protein, putative isoform 3 [Hibiscus syriacus]
MSPRCDNISLSGCKVAECSCPPLPRSGPQRSSVSFLSESPVPAFVFSRKKRQGRSGGCPSVVSSDALLVATLEQNRVSHVEHRNVAVGDTVMPLARSREPRSLKYEFANGCSGVNDHSFDDVHKTVMQKTIDVDSINDRCSSSKSTTDILSASKKVEVDENAESTSSSVIAAEVVRGDLFEKVKCVPVLQKQKNVEEVGISRVCANEEIGTSSGSRCSRLCNICGRSGTTQKMLICDSCEEAFHMRCCNLKVKKIPVDEWNCILCLKKKRIMHKEIIARRPSSITGGMGRDRDVSSKWKVSPIELMLRDAEPYRTSVRIGKGFQAEVPDCSGPIDNDVDTIGEPLNLDISEFTDFHEMNCNKSSKVSSIGNWLQCRDFIEGVGGSKGTICGKWRRAPLFVVQTDDWECFCSVQWDPSHADCSVPQELETDQILKQLKYIEMLRPQLSAKRRNCTSMKRRG